MMRKRELKVYNPDGVDDDEQCIVCYARCKNIIFKRCRHMIICDRCFNDPVHPIRQCPKCREDVDDAIEVKEYEKYWFW